MTEAMQFTKVMKSHSFCRRSDKNPGSKQGPSHKIEEPIIKPAQDIGE